ncbi:hypothetical protein DID75_03735 [Candidatus Marinamargulisbacteria bacterium SCGC AG-410-N11]|nr:hypothetical protein DID75_03735 [Candidatus Marinamargulisbacteria bacterium SCGC AG-410-N11]
MSFLFLVPLTGLLMVISCLMYVNTCQCIQPFLRLYRIFFSIVGCILLFSLLNLLTYNQLIGLWLHRLEMVGILSLSMISIVIVYDYLEIKTNLLVKLFCLGQLFLIGICVTPLVVKSIRLSNWGLSLVAGNLYYDVMILVTGLFMFLALRVLVSLVRDNVSTVKKVQAICVFFGMVMNVLTVGLFYGLSYYFNQSEIIGLVGSIGFIFPVFLLSGSVIIFLQSALKVKSVAPYLFRNTQNGVLILDKNGEAVHTNESTLQLLDKGYSEVYGKQMNHLFSDQKENDSSSYQKKVVKLKNKDQNVEFYLSQGSALSWRNQIGKLIVFNKKKDLNK